MTPTVAAGAYSAVAKLTNGGQGTPAVDRLAGGADFGGMLNQVMGGLAASGQAAEAGVVGVAQGKADVVEVVTALADTQATLETMVAIRDRVISAYEDILRMPM